MDDLYRYQRMNPSAPAASHVAALNKILQAGGTNTNGLSGANVVNEYAAQMRDPRQVAMDSRRRFRGMSGVQRAQYMDQEVIRNEAMGDGRAHQINLHNPFGATLDEQHQNDREFYAPGTRAVVESARKNFDEQFAGLMTGANKQAWGSTKDIERAVNGLEATQKYGPLIENHIQQRVRASLSPAVQAQFEAHDKNVQSFVDRKRGMGDTRPEDEIAQDYDNPIDQQLWREDINARKFEQHPSGKGVVEVQPSRQQQADAQLAAAIREQQALRDAESDMTEQWKARNPEAAARYEEAPPKSMIEKPKPEPTADERVQQKLDEEAAMEAGRIKRGLKPAPVKAADPVEEAKIRVQAGEPVPSVNGKPVLPLNEDGKENPIYNAMTENVWIDPDGKVSKLKLLGIDPVRRLKPQFKQWAPEGTPAPAAPQVTATNPKTGERLVLKDGKWIPLK